MSDDIHRAPDNLVSKSGLFKGMNMPMGFMSAVMIISFILYTIWDVEASSAVFASGKSFIIGTMDWFTSLLLTSPCFSFSG